ncbi:MAG: Calx-beta domain-containing protein [Pirellulales bacterium]
MRRFRRPSRRTVRLIEQLEGRLLLSGDPSLAASLGGAAHPLQEMFADSSDLTPKPTYAPGEILIKLRAQPALQSIQSAPALRFPASAASASQAFVGPAEPTGSLQSLLTFYGGASMNAVFPREVESQILGAGLPQAPPADGGASDPRIAERAALASWYHVSLPPDTDIEKAVADFRATPEVAAAEPNWEWRLADMIDVPMEGLPNSMTDPRFDEQWFDVNAKVPNAWWYLKNNGVFMGGSRDVVIAVIDTGVDYTHEDLVANMWVNSGEIPGNGIDDDGNGFVDDVHGASTVSDPRSHSGDSSDYHGHGTHVAGIAAASGFNQRGGVGVGFNTQIMSIRAAQYSGTLVVQDIAEAVLYAVDNGAEVINMSFGGWQRSQVVEDALEVALNQAVLVAAAGNDGASSQRYPAALPYVLGVGASTIKNKKAWFSNKGDVLAPGEAIVSTLPGNNYAAWSGTSMATPVVSGIAALARSFFWQRDLYSSRFLMGCIYGSTNGGVVDAYAALTTPPTPGVTVYENWLFDTPTISPSNDGDGRADSGETLHVAVELINRSGFAENVTGTLRARAQGAVMDDPFVTITTPMISFGSMGPFAINDNGLIWDESGVITGVDRPFVFTVSPDCPNDHIIPFEMTLNFEDGWSRDHTAMTRVSRFEYIVQRGKNIPRVISTDLELTAADYWIVGGPVLVESGATLTIREGTQIQWGAISDDPYNPGPQQGYIIVRGALSILGTEDRPVNLFPSYLVSGQTTRITVDGGRADLQYATVRNPELVNFTTIDHGYFDWDQYTSQIYAQRISNSIFHKFRGGGAISAYYDYRTCLFDAGWVGPRGDAMLLDSVLLQDNENNRALTLGPWFDFNSTWLSKPQLVTVHDGNTYALLRSGDNWKHLLPAYEAIAGYFGGHLASVANSEEEAFLASYWASNPWPPGAYFCNALLGLTDLGHPGTYEWIDGTPLTYTNWAPGYPVNNGFHDKNVVRFRGWDEWNHSVNGWHNVTWGNTADYFIVRLPGTWTEAQLAAPFQNGEMWDYLRTHLRGYYLRNAFLNKYWDPNISHWMRVVGSTNDGAQTSFSSTIDNYWGTTTRTLVDHVIQDYYDTFDRARIEYGTLPEHGFESTYPFVESVLIDGVPADWVPTLATGQAEFAVTFNRDMDPSIQPFVTFGPSPPHTDFTVHPVGNTDAPFGRNDAEFVVTLSTPSSRTVTVDYVTTDGTAVAGVDYEFTQGTLTFRPGETQQTIAVPAIGDCLEEEKVGRTFFVQLSNPTFATLAEEEGQGTIVEDDSTLSISDVRVLEGNAGTTDAVFTVTLSAACAEPVTVEYETVDGTAKAGADYQPTADELVFEPGQTEKTIAVPVIGDTTTETNETFSVKLLRPTRVNLVKEVGEATIVADDGLLLSIDDVAVLEGSSGMTNATLTVRLSQNPAQNVTVAFSTADGTAIAGTDYETTGGTLTFQPGQPLQQTITVPVNGDTVDEIDEDLLVRLSNPTGGAIADPEGRVTVGDDDDPLLWIDDVVIAEGDSGESDAVFTVTLSAPAVETTTVRYATTDSTATLAGSDYRAADGTLVFQPGQTEQKILVHVLGDTLDEIDENFAVNLSSPTHAGIAKGQGAGTIRDDEPKITIDDVAIVEGDSGTTNAVFTVSIGAPSTHPVTLSFATTDGTATAGVDYEAQNGTLVFEPGQPIQQTISVPIHADTFGEVNETFLVNLSNIVGAALADSQGQGTIVGDDGPLLSITDAVLVEGDNGTTDMVFTVSLSAPAAELVTLRYATADGTATAGVDYHPADATLAFVPGAPLEQTVYVPVIGDLVNELNETFSLKLFDATVVGISRPQGTGTITDDDPLFSIDDVTVVEGISGATDAVFTVSLSAPVTRTTTVAFATANGTATQGSDYQAAGGTLVFEPGQPTQQTITVHVLGDMVNETHETFFVNLSGATHAGLPDTQGVCTITDDDGPKLSIDDATLAEGDSGTPDMVFTVRLSQAVTQTVTVDFATANGTAASGLDYQAKSGTLTFEPGQAAWQTIVVPVIGDVVDESDETLIVNLSNATNVPLADAQGVGTITDDEDAVLSITDVTVAEGFNGWENARTWKGTQWITPVTGDGYQLMRVSGAVAADDPWLVSGYDVGRFRFKVETMGLAAMNLQASGAEGAIQLTWRQDDYDLLAGYNVYRSTSLDGTYTKINTTIVPVGEEHFTDTNVTPAVPMYYKFTVLTTDMTESDFSNVASAAAVDTIAPVIVHVPETSATPGRGLRLAATVTDNLQVDSVTLHYRPLGDSVAFAALAMVNVSGHEWSATIPGSAVQPPGVEYYLTATDGISQVFHGTPAAPHSVVVVATPTLSSVAPNQGAIEGGQLVTLSGTLFQAGASVLFGGVPASNVVVLSANQITCIAPPHFPAQVDVIVVNPDDTQCTLLNGYRFVDENVVVSLPAMSGDRGAIVEIPVSVSNVDGLGAADLTITFDSNVLAARSARTGTLSFGWSLSTNTATPGRVVLSLANATVVSGSGVLANITFEVVGAATTQTALTVANALLNDGAVACELSPGSFTVNGLFDVSGTVNYYSGGTVPGVAISLVGVGVRGDISDTDGRFSINDAPTGAYTLSAAKSDDVAEITAYDASLVLQSVAGLVNLSANERLAADVNRNGAVTSMDAFHILQKSVGLLDLPFPGAGRIWHFVPETRGYPLLNSDQAGQDFTAMLLGDVSGNWPARAGGSPPAGLQAGPSAGEARLTVPQVESALERVFKSGIRACQAA